MERWGVRERVCPVELFIRTGSITETQRGFRRERNQQKAPSRNGIRRWVRQWREEGCATCKNPRGRPSSVRTPDNIARVLASVSRSPRRSALTQARRNVTQRWSMNFYPRIFHQTVLPCGFNKMVLRPTRLWLASLCFVLCFPQRVISRFGDVPWPPRSPDLTAPDFFFSVGLFEEWSVQYSPYRLTCTQRKHTGRIYFSLFPTWYTVFPSTYNICYPTFLCILGFWDLLGRAS